MKSYSWTDCSITPKFRNSNLQLKKKKFVEGELSSLRVLNTIKFTGLRTKKLPMENSFVSDWGIESFTQTRSPTLWELWLIVLTLCFCASVLLWLLFPYSPSCTEKVEVSHVPQPSCTTLKALTLCIFLFAVSCVVLKSSCPLPSICLGDNAFKEQLGWLLDTK